MARLAFVVGVSENIRPLNSLAACQNDAKAIGAILKQDGRFDDIVVYTGRAETAARNIKDRLSEFVDKYKSSAVEELIFYFSGHGDFSGDEFYHILSDYDPNARNQTSLANSELDGMLRALSPELYVKIVDACHSGTSYIKSSEGLDEYLKAATNRFKNLYFLYSSQSDEVSWTAGTLSAFTSSLLSAVARSDSGPIRYRDLMSAASDHFEAAGRQRPQFVTQADFTQVFCVASPRMQAVIEKFLPKPSASLSPSASSTSGKSSSLLERIKDTEAKFCSRDEAVSALENFKDVLFKLTLSEDLNSIFDLHTAESTAEYDNASAVGDWLAKRADRAFFAKPVYRTEMAKRIVQREPSIFGMSLWATQMRARETSSQDQRSSDRDSRVVETPIRVISGYLNTASLPFAALTLRLEPKFRAVTPQEFYVVPVISATAILVFWTMRQFTRSDWDTVEPEDSPLKWESAEASLKNTEELAATAEQIKVRFSTLSDAALKAGWPEPTQAKPIGSLIRRPRGGMMTGQNSAGLEGDE